MITAENTPVAEHARENVGSLDEIIKKVSESKGGVVELSMDQRGLTDVLPK